MGVAVGVNREVGIAVGSTAGASVGRKIKGAVGRGVGVGAAGLKILQPVNRASPMIRIAVRLMFIAFSSV